MSFLEMNLFPIEAISASKMADSVKGHRERLRERFLKGGKNALQDYEFLELILFRVIPRRDVKPLAKQLIEQFGDLAGVLSAEPAILKVVKGLGTSAIVDMKIIEATAQELTKNRVKNKPILNSWTSLINYCKASMAHLHVEQFRLIFLDRKNYLIADEVIQQGTVDHVPVYPREVVKRALEMNASSVILVHNHPSGDPTPSHADIEVTNQITNACKTVNIAVHDHIIIGRDSEVSLRALGCFD